MGALAYHRLPGRQGRAPAATRADCTLPRGCRGCRAALDERRGRMAERSGDPSGRLRPVARRGPDRRGSVRATRSASSAGPGPGSACMPDGSVAPLALSPLRLARRRTPASLRGSHRRGRRRAGRRRRRACGPPSTARRPERRCATRCGGRDRATSSSSCRPPCSPPATTSSSSFRSCSAASAGSPRPPPGAGPSRSHHRPALLPRPARAGGELRLPRLRRLPRASPAALGLPRPPGSPSATLLHLAMIMPEVRAPLRIASPRRRWR